MYPKYPVLNRIQRIHLLNWINSPFLGFSKEKSICGLKNPDLDFFKESRPNVQNNM